MAKSSVKDIRTRFDNDVERFSSLETGQRSFVDAEKILNRTTRAAAATMPSATHLLDVGCGAGNYTLKFLEYGPGVHIDLVDLSQPMLDRAVERVEAATSGAVRPTQADIRECDLEPERYDVILAAAVLHHLRTDAEWETVAAKFYEALCPGGALWVADLVDHGTPSVDNVMWNEYGMYLEALDGAAYREEVFGYIEKEDTPRPLLEQISFFRRAGFRTAEILHKNTTFAAFGVMK